VPPFEQLVEKGVDCLQENISQNYMTIFLLASFLIYHWGCLKSCVGLGVNVWFLTHAIILFFPLGFRCFIQHIAH
jgi:hypothetical protein